ncbi:hypothetical protein K1719_011100 [Acacia pycnantha]|nr:hypothetical protein K1719_011100 [Acacia pycnantha]
MALVLSKKGSLVPSNSEDDDLLHRSSKKIKNGGGSEREEEWPKLRKNGAKFDSESEMEDGQPLCLITEEANRNFPKFTFSEKMKKRLHKAWRQAVIVKLLGRNIGYKSLLSILQTLWAKCGIITLINISNGFFVVKLSNKEDYLNALTGGPWMLYDHYLTVRPWEPRATMEGYR